MAGAVTAEGPGSYRLRPDLGICAWDSGEGGQPRCLIHDPATRGIAIVSWPETLMLGPLRRGATPAVLRETVAARSTLRPTDADALDFIKRLGGRGWLEGGAFWPSYTKPRRRTLISRMLAAYLYCRVTLLRPDAFLTRTLPFVRWLGSGMAILALLFLVSLGIYLALPRWEEFAAAVSRLADWRNLPWILPAIAGAKMAHEFAHAYAAKAGGARVDGMGLAFIMLLPLPFTDVTDAWRLSRRRRFWVAAAGLAAELAVAGIMLPAWVLAPPGTGKDLCLVFATTALASTLAVNLNPGVRFDGYYMLSHLAGVENLRERSLRFLVWRWRRWFWGIGQPDPEPGAPKSRRVWFLFYAVFAWLYRLSLFTAIAVAIYHLLPKVFGAIMFVAVGWSFVVGPAISEAAALARKRNDMNRRAIATLAVLLCLAVWLIVPMPRRTSLPAVVQLPEARAVAAVSGEIVFTDAAEGVGVRKGTVLARVRRMETEAETLRAGWSAEEAKRLAETSWLSKTGRKQLPGLEARALAAGMAAEASRIRETLALVTAPGDGVVESWEPWVRTGVFVHRGGVLGVVRLRGGATVTALVDVGVAGRYEPGQSARFLPDCGGPWLEGEVVRIEPHRVETLDNGILAQLVGGEPDGRGWRLRRPMNRMIVRIDGEYPLSGQTGRLWLDSKPYSLVGEAWNRLVGLLVRESGL